MMTATGQPRLERVRQVQAEPSGPPGTGDYVKNGMSGHARQWLITIVLCFCVTVWGLPTGTIVDRGGLRCGGVTGVAQAVGSGCRQGAMRFAINIPNFGDFADPRAVAVLGRRG